MRGNESILLAVPVATSFNFSSYYLTCEFVLPPLVSYSHKNASFFSLRFSYSQGYSLLESKIAACIKGF